MILPNEIKKKSFKNSDPENYSQTLEAKIDDALRYDSGKNRVHCDLVLHCLTTRSINTLFKYIDAGYDVTISNDYETLTISHYFKE